MPSLLFFARSRTSTRLTIAAALARVVSPVIGAYLEGTHVLDVGCGGGRLALELAQPPQVIVGVDPSRAQVRRFLRRHGPGPTLRGKAETLPFRSASFDSVYSSCAYKHWGQQQQGLSECFRVARPGGRVVIVEIDGDATPQEFRRFADHSRVPVGLRSSYVRFAMRTMVGVAPNREQLVHVFDGLGTSGLTICALEGMPFLLAVATKL